MTCQSLILPLRVFSLWFLIDGFDSLGFALAIRRKQARLQMYSELAASVLTTTFSIVYCYRYHTFWGIAFAHASQSADHDCAELSVLSRA